MAGLTGIEPVLRDRQSRVMPTDPSSAENLGPRTLVHTGHALTLHAQVCKKWSGIEESNLCPVLPTHGDYHYQNSRRNFCDPPSRARTRWVFCSPCGASETTDGSLEPTTTVVCRGALGENSGVCTVHHLSTFSGATLLFSSVLGI